MPLASRIAIRAAIAWLVVGAVMGLVVALARAGWVTPAGYRALAVHVPALLIGWFAQFVVGVAHWMMPKFARSDPRHPRGDERLFLAGVIVLNVALVAVVAGRLVSGSLERVGAALVLVSLASCAARIWPRIKAFGR